MTSKWLTQASTRTSCCRVHSQKPVDSAASQADNFLIPRASKYMVGGDCVMCWASLVILTRRIRQWFGCGQYIHGVSQEVRSPIHLVFPKSYYQGSRTRGLEGVHRLHGWYWVLLIWYLLYFILDISPSFPLEIFPLLYLESGLPINQVI